MLIVQVISNSYAIDPIRIKINRGYGLLFRHRGAFTVSMDFETMDAFLYRICPQYFTLNKQYSIISIISYS